MAELFGKNSKMAKGKAGSMHLVDIDRGIIPASAVVGTTIPVSAGYALANKMQKNNKVVLCMFGDGSTEEGCFLETINFAALHKLAMVFVCENNKLAIHNPIHRRQATDKICERISTYGLKTYKIESGDVIEMITKCKEAVELARSGNGPVFMEIFTHRYLEHVGPGCDIDEKYRDKEYDEKWKKLDQIEILAKSLTNNELVEISREVDDIIEKAVEYASNLPYAPKEELFKNVYAK
jgi:pyruvate dehydrogenase E1 component alpha subunit